MAFVCVICEGTAGTAFVVREMMFGTNESFRYTLCAHCGCFQLTDTVQLDRHYPSAYDAFRIHARPTGVSRWLRTTRNKGVFRGHPLGRVLGVFRPYPVAAAERWFRRARVALDARILDVGCGSGELIRDLLECGFTRVEGIDPFIPDRLAAQMPPGVRRLHLADVDGAYDLIMLHHVLEHVPEQQEALRHIARLLRPGGICLIRTPVIPNAVWERYRENWVQLDAPRHVLIHSEKSLTLCASHAGLQLVHCDFDSTEFQFVGSERYRRGITLSAPFNDLTRAHFRHFRREARRLNRAGRGDQAAFYFRKPPGTSVSGGPGGPGGSPSRTA